jgi:site-specific recombinase XerC
MGTESPRVDGGWRNTPSRAGAICSPGVLPPANDVRSLIAGVKRSCGGNGAAGSARSVARWSRRCQPVATLLDGRAANPADDLRPPRAWATLPTRCRRAGGCVINQPDVSTPGLRDRAMIELLYATGCPELVGIRATTCTSGAT